MKAYIGTKTIKAKPMNRLDYNKFRGWQLPDNENGNDDGYLVEYTDGGKPNTSAYDGYVSWSPKEQFENAYKESGKLSFGDAIHYLKAGKKLARSGWDGKGMFIFLVPANKYPASGNKNGTLIGEFKDDLVPYGAYLAMKTAQDNIIPWLASQTDMLADDWEII